MAQAKLDDASILLSNKRYSNAYYLAGYSIELGLKACIARQISAETIPDKALIKRILDHQFGTLIGLAGLATALKEQQDKNPILLPIGPLYPNGRRILDTNRQTRCQHS